MKILIADDSPSALMLLSRVLDSWGYETISVVDGTAALEVLTSQQDVRLAILDWMMPGLDGPQVCEAVQSFKRFVYLILLTGRDSKDDIAHGFAKGASDFIQKPFQPVELKARIGAAERLLNLQSQLASMQKLESLGRLASGIAHEINTPTQFANDNVHFVKESFDELSELLVMISKLEDSNEDAAKQIAEIRKLGESAEIDYLLTEIPTALEQSIEGISRIATIVSSMKAFSHPDTETKRPVDLSQTITDTINVARNEWKYAAELHTDFDPELQEVMCFSGELNQVILAIIVNAAHAIQAAQEDRGEESQLGRIDISTRMDGDSAEIRIKDNGSGIPEEIRDKIFEPFFTTKAVGVGTGQGLAIAHTAIADKHNGQLFAESEVGVGSTFVIRIPIDE